MFTFGLYTSFVTLLSYIVMSVLEKKLNIEKEIPEHRHVNRLHKWLERIFICSLIVIVVILFISKADINYFLLSGFVSVYLVIVGFIQWKYEKEEKQFVRSVVGIIASLTIFIPALIIWMDTDSFEEVAEEVNLYKNDLEAFESVEIVNYARNGDAQELADQLIEKRRVLINDREEKESLLDELYSLELNESYVVKEEVRDYFYSIRLIDEFNRDIHIDIYKKDVIWIEDSFYKIVGNSNIYQFLESANLEWQHPEKSSS